MKKLWTCPKCRRKFAKENQTHSCNLYPLDKHFERKEEIARPLYDELTARMKKEIGPFRVDSIPCCIHFVTNFTFAAVYALKDKIRVSFTLDRLLRSSRMFKHFQMSRKRYNYRVEIKSKKEIDGQLLNWLKQAYDLRRK